MIRKTKLNDREMNVVKDLVKHFGIKNLIQSRQALTIAHGVIREGKAASPFFITRNLAAKAKDEKGKLVRGMYNLGVFLASQPKPKKSKAPKSVETV